MKNIFFMMLIVTLFLTQAAAAEQKWLRPGDSKGDTFMKMTLIPFPEDLYNRRFLPNFGATNRGFTRPVFPKNQLTDELEVNKMVCDHFVYTLFDHYGVITDVSKCLLLPAGTLGDIETVNTTSEFNIMRIEYNVRLPDGSTEGRVGFYVGNRVFGS